MIDYAAQLAGLRLFTELENSAGRDKLSQTDVTQLAGMVNHAAAVAGPLLELIPQTFRQYTNHNIGHCRNLIDLMGRFIPEETLGRLNGLELAVLLLSALLHDFGMFVSDKDRTEALKRETLATPEFDSFRAGHLARASAVEEARRAGEYERAEVIQDSLLADYFRRMHPQRARDNVRANLAGRLVFRELDISPYVLDVCESHSWGVYESVDPLHPEKTVSQLPTNCAVHGFPLNLQYIACCLRLADIMDFDRSRTPVVVFQNINFTDEKSWEEWNKHLSVGGWKIDEREVLFRTECAHPSFYVAVMEFLDWVDAELSDCRRLVVKMAPRDVAERYRLHLPPVVDRWDVEMADKSYLAGGFRFQLEYERIMQLLMDKSLYPDPSLFLRELLQNALDACRNMEALAKEYEYEGYTPRIAVWDHSDDPDDPRVVFQDNGVGMSRKIVENYFMRVGRSYYRSPEFDAERARLKRKGAELEATSQFGIGILSCFMVADHFEVETYRTGYVPLRITIEGPTKYFIIKVLDPPPTTPFPLKPTSDADDGPPSHTGTRITVHLRPGVIVDVLQTLNTFAVNVDYDIRVYCPDAAEPQIIPQRRWEAEMLYAGALVGAINTDRMGWRSKAPLRGTKDLSKLKIAENLGDVLVPSLIPFEKYEFSKNLKGSAWFWLLRGEAGGVCARRGDLQIRYDVNLTGLPALLRHISGNAQVGLESREWAEFIRLLKKNQDGTEGRLGAAADYGHVLSVFGRFGLAEAHRDAELAINMWERLTAVEQLVACDFLASMNEGAEVWYEAEGVPLELLRGSREWVNRPLRFDWDVGIEAFPQSLSLHGTLLPAGFVKWDPMTGKSESLKLLNVASGVLVDMRGQDTPTPVASRLSVLWTEGRKVAVPFLRATLYHALELVSSDPEDYGWHDWLSYFWFSLRGLHFWPDVIQQEYDLLESQLKYAAFVRGSYCYLSRERLVTVFGNWVPVRDPRVGNDGLYVYDESTTLLILFKERRERPDGVWEVDMRSRVSVHDETFDRRISQIQREILYR